MKLLGPNSTYAWALKDVPPQQVADMVNTLPQPVRTWAGRILWWDKYSVLGIPAPMFMVWVRDRHTPEPDTKELAEALEFLGYGPDFSKLRACGGDSQRESVMEIWNE